MTESQLQNGELLVETVMQRTNGQTVQISPPFPVRRRSRFYGNRHMWQVTVPNLKRQLGRTLQKGPGVGVASVTAKATFNTMSDISAEAELVLVPHQDDGGHAPRLQLTTSTPEPRVGNNVILHLRSNYDLTNDFYLIVMSGGRLLTSKQDSMGFTKLKTFDQLITTEMTPSVTFVLWNLDSRGAFVHTSLTIQSVAKTNTTVSRKCK